MRLQFSINGQDKLVVSGDPGLQMRETESGLLEVVTCDSDDLVTLLDATQLEDPASARRWVTAKRAQTSVDVSGGDSATLAQARSLARHLVGVGFKLYRGTETGTRRFASPNDHYTTVVVHKDGIDGLEGASEDLARSFATDNGFCHEAALRLLGPG